MRERRSTNLMKIVFTLGFTMMFSVVLGVSASAQKLEIENGVVNNVNNWEDLAETIGNQEANTTVLYKVCNDLVVDRMITINEKKKVIIMPNKYYVNIQRDKGYFYEFFKVTDGGSLSVAGLNENSKLGFVGTAKKESDQQEEGVSGRFAKVDGGATFTINKFTQIQGFKLSAGDDRAKNDSACAASMILNEMGTVIIKGGSIYGNPTPNKNEEDICQKGTLIFDLDNSASTANSIQLSLYISSYGPPTTTINSNCYLARDSKIIVDLSKQYKLSNKEPITVGGNNISGNFDTTFVKGTNFPEEEKGKPMGLKPALIATSLSLKTKTVTYTGKPISIDSATVSPSGLSNKVVYTYYTDNNHKNKTTKEKNGSEKDGGAPRNAGTYYVVASLAANGNYSVAKDEAELVINKKPGKITVKNATINLLEKKNANIEITSNLDNMEYDVSDFDKNLVNAFKSNGTIVCQAKKCGISTVTIKTKGNANIEPCSVKVTMKVAPAKIKIKKAKSVEKKKLFVQWKVSKTATGYDIQYARNSKFTKKAKTRSVLCSKAKKGKGNAKNLKRNATYYVRIRAYYQASNGEKIVGPWSAKKKVKIK